MMKNVTLNLCFYVTVLTIFDVNGRCLTVTGVQPTATVNFKYDKNMTKKYQHRRAVMGRQEQASGDWR